MPAEMVVVGAAILRGSAPHTEVLAAQRADPPALAGGWEFVGGKVEPDEDEVAALRRECREELGVEICVGERVGADVQIAGVPRDEAGKGATLRVWTAAIVAGEASPIEHRELRWLSTQQLYDVQWLPADLPVVAALHRLLSPPQVPATPPSQPLPSPGMDT